MPFQYQTFEADGIEVPLPLYNPEQEHSPMPAKSRYIQVIGGSVDAWGANDSDSEGIQTHTLTGIYWGDTTYLVDEAGNRFVDEAGNPFIFGNSSTMLRSQITALREVYRKQGTLWRAYIEEGTLAVAKRDWKTATFDQMSQPQVTGDRVFKATLTLGFSTLMQNWHAETQTTASVSTTAGVAATMMVENAGETVEDAALTVTRTGGTITTVSVACATLGISWFWAGSLGTGNVLTIDDGPDTIIKSGVAAYSGFGRTGHTAKTLLTIPKGLHFFTVVTQGGAADIALKFYTQVK